MYMYMSCVTDSYLSDMNALSETQCVIRGDACLHNVCLIVKIAISTEGSFRLIFQDRVRISVYCKSVMNEMYCRLGKCDQSLMSFQLLS